MENETEHEIQEEPIQEKSKKFGDKYMIPKAIKNSAVQNGQAILSDGGNILPLEVEKKMLATLVANGSIDPSKLPQVTELNLLWAYGLANKNQVLESGPIVDPRYGGPTNMASVGG